MDINYCIIYNCNNISTLMGYCSHHSDLSYPILVRKCKNICNKCNNHTSIYSHLHCYIHSETDTEFLYHINNPQIINLMQKYPEISWINNYINFYNNYLINN